MGRGGWGPMRKEAVLALAKGFRGRAKNCIRVRLRSRRPPPPPTPTRLPPAAPPPTLQSMRCDSLRV